MSGKSFSNLFNVLLEYTTCDFANIEKTAADAEKQDPAALLARLHTSVEAFDNLIKVEYKQTKQRERESWGGVRERWMIKVFEKTTHVCVSRIKTHLCV
jgi:hypothetical protein